MASDRPPLPPSAFHSILNNAFVNSPFPSTLSPYSSPSSNIVRRTRSISINSPSSPSFQAKRSLFSTQTLVSSLYSNHITNSPKKQKTIVIINTVNFFKINPTSTHLIIISANLRVWPNITYRQYFFALSTKSNLHRA